MVQGVLPPVGHCSASVGEGSVRVVAREAVGVVVGGGKGPSFFCRCYVFRLECFGCVRVDVVPAKASRSARWRGSEDMVSSGQGARREAGRVKCSPFPFPIPEGLGFDIHRCCDKEDEPRPRVILPGRVRELEDDVWPLGLEGDRVRRWADGDRLTRVDTKDGVGVMSMTPDGRCLLRVGGDGGRDSLRLG